MKTYSYDTACEVLAEYFLGTERKQEDVQELAQNIQTAVEDWLNGKEREDKDRAVVQATVAKQNMLLCPKCGSDSTKYETGMGQRLTCFDCGRIGPPLYDVDELEALLARLRAEAEPCLSPAEKKAQAARCSCHGSDDYCPCQNAPDATTRAARREGSPS